MQQKITSFIEARSLIQISERDLSADTTQNKQNNLNHVSSPEKTGRDWDEHTLNH
ncbi:hypothetical protein [Tolypothrix sp. VBCCA 56010]|uniref:hypothetical protein n=1 Tax=Tolypothrix sp. VBCCA 56010 TaxID=3137731 RepID=UPI003D7DCB81